MPTMRLLLFCLFLWNQSAFCQQSKSLQYWHKGCLVLAKNQEKILGELKVNYLTNSLSLKNNEGEKSYYVSQIESFYLMDSILERRRNFVTLSVLNEKDFPKKMIFEVISEGECTLLCREEFMDTFNKNYSEVSPHEANKLNNSLSINFYCIRDGKVVDFIADKKGILAILSDKEELVNEHIKEEKLNFKKNKDVRKVFEFYNSLFN